MSSSTITAKSPDGDKVEVTIHFSEPVPADQVTNSAVTACAGDLQTFGFSLSRAVAVPVEADMTVLSSMPVSVSFGLGETMLLGDGGNVYASDGGNVQAWWAESFSSGDECVQFATGDKRVTWSQAVPGTTYRWHEWLVIANAITPNDPTGQSSVAKEQAYMPTLTFGIQYPSSERNTGRYACTGTSGTFAAGPYVVSDEEEAVMLGCQPA